MLTDFDGGKVSTLPGGQTLHEYDGSRAEQDHRDRAGRGLSGVTYNGRIPGPTFRVREGDRVRINFFNAGDHSSPSLVRASGNVDSDVQKSWLRARNGTAMLPL